MTTAKAKDLLLEIGCEELPPSAVAAVRGGLGQLAVVAESTLQEARLSSGAPKLEVFATPRRILLFAQNIPVRQETEVKTVVGPPKSAAYDAGGKLTPAGLGFLKKWGLAEKDLRLDKTPKGEYLAADVASLARAATEVLPELLAGMITALSFPKTMRWPQAEVAFPRPIRWLVCLFGGEVVPLEYAGLTAGAQSYGHRTIAPAPRDLAALFGADGTIDGDVGRLKDFYKTELGVVIDYDDRREMVKRQLREIGGAGDYVEKADYHVKWTFERVLDEVERPSLVAGAFDPKYLELPAEVVAAAMLGYLHLFPVKNKRGELEPKFFAIHNARPEAEGNVRAGLERVLAARLADAAYFWEADKQAPLADMATALDGVVFAEGAGTLADKAARLTRLTAALAERLALTAEEKADLARAAALCKADLTSQMVREQEFAHLQGTMGKLYAKAAGEAPAVAEAIGEHYRPVAADDPLPATKLGRILALADRLDTLVVLFAAGHRPTGAKDPFGLRRAAIAVCRSLLEDGEGLFNRLAVEQAVAHAAELAQGQGAAADVLDFVISRLRQNFLERGFRDDMVNAVLALPERRPADLLKRVSALAAFYENREEYVRLAIAFKRPINILRQGNERNLTWGELDEELMTQLEERQLLAEYREVEPSVRAAVARGDYDEALTLLAKMRPTVDTFFDEVMVMCEDERLRSNRLALMQLLADLFLSFADFARLRGEEEYE